MQPIVILQLADLFGVNICCNEVFLPAPIASATGSLLIGPLGFLFGNARFSWYLRFAIRDEDVTTMCRRLVSLADSVMP